MRWAFSPIRCRSPEFSISSPIRAADASGASGSIRTMFSPSFSSGVRADRVRLYVQAWHAHGHGLQQARAQLRVALHARVVELRHVERGLRDVGGHLVVGHVRPRHPHDVVPLLEAIDEVEELVLVRKPVEEPIALDFAHDHEHGVRVIPLDALERGQELVQPVPPEERAVVEEHDLARELLRYRLHWPAEARGREVVGVEHPLGRQPVALSDVAPMRQQHDEPRAGEDETVEAAEERLAQPGPAQVHVVGGDVDDELPAQRPEKEIRVELDEDREEGRVARDVEEVDRVAVLRRDHGLAVRGHEREPLGERVPNALDDRVADRIGEDSHGAGPLGSAGMT